MTVDVVLQKPSSRYMVTSHMATFEASMYQPLCSLLQATMSNSSSITSVISTLSPWSLTLTQALRHLISSLGISRVRLLRTEAAITN